MDMESGASNSDKDLSEVPEVEEVTPEGPSKRSWIHDYFVHFKNSSEFQCKLCKKKLKEQKNHSTGNLHNHIRLCHSALHKEKTLSSPSTKRPKLMQLDLGEKIPIKKREPLTREEFLNKLVKFIIETDQPFSIVERPAFRELLNFISKDSEATKIPGRTSITSNIKDKFEAEKLKLITELSMITSKVSIVIDCWTSKNQKAFQGVVVRFIDNDWKLQTIPIDLTELAGPHTGENIAHSLFPVLKEYKLLDKLLCITTDNASNMDTFFKSFTNLMEKEGLSFDPENQRVRCLAHIVNLCARAVIDGFENLEPYGNIIKKLREAIVGIRSSPQRREIFRNITKTENAVDKMLILDCKTRWNSTFDMISRALELRAGLSASLKVIKDLKQYSLDDEEWEHLHKLCNFLKPIKQATAMISKEKSPNIASSTLIYHYLFEHLESYQTKVPNTSRRKQNTETNTEWMSSLADLGVAKLEKYYPESDGKPYVVGTVIHPGFKLEWYKQAKWPSDWIKKFQSQTQEEWNRNYKPRLPEVNLDEGDNGNEMDFFSSLYKKQMGNSARGPIDELKKYLSDPVVSSDIIQTTGLLGWWKNHESEFPGLAKMAQDYCAVAGSGVPVESLFSEATDILDDNRLSMNAENIKILLCLKCWFKNGRD